MSAPALRQRTPTSASSRNHARRTPTCNRDRGRALSGSVLIRACPPMVVVRRLLLLWLLMFWLGGFTFYAGVVVPIGTEVLESSLAQGWITRRVTTWLNVAAAVTLAAWAWDLAAGPAPAPRQWLRWLLWVGM